MGPNAPSSGFVRRIIFFVDSPLVRIHFKNWSNLQTLNAKHLPQWDDEYAFSLQREYGGDLF